jgi:hypothetical protein
MKEINTGIRSCVLRAKGYTQINTKNNTKQGLKSLANVHGRTPQEYPHAQRN